MRAIGIGRLSRHDDSEAIGEGVLDCGANADIGLDACDDDPLDPLFAQEEGEIGGEKRAVTALGADDLACSSGAKPLKNAASGSPWR